MGLVERGAALIDADAIVRELQQPGGIVLAAMVEHFGEVVLTESGELDRQAVAGIVFNDEVQLAALNKIVHPAVLDELAAQRRKLEGTDRILIADIALLVGADGSKATRKEYDAFLGVVVVDCEVDVAVERLVRFRGFDEDDARARIANQATREHRRAIADFVIDNSGELGALEPQLDMCWAWLQSVVQT